ncbi:HNH endonuclease [Streptomyces sp. NPDC059385]|uniref:HNH endonuclease n=1 Tax=Streptomyces sp. NPDC059385 TaxID=3346817 RepID=UPI0036770B3B
MQNRQQDATLLIKPEDSRLGRPWVAAEKLLAAGWSRAAVRALIAENLVLTDDQGPGMKPLYHLAQIQAVRQDRRLSPYIDGGDARFWAAPATLTRVKELQRKAWPEARDHAETVARYLQTRGTQQALDLSPRQRVRRRTTVDPAPTPIPLRPPAASKQPKPAAPVHSHPADETDTLHPASPAATPKPAALPAPSANLPTAELARAYQRLARTAERRAEDTRGQRQASGARPIRIPSARRAVILRSGGRCESPLCAGGQPVDITDSGEPLLDVDHVDELAAGGADHPAQMIALCPNCHRVKTLGRTRHDLIPVLRETARRLHAELDARR